MKYIIYAFSFLFSTAAILAYSVQEEWVLLDDFSEYTSGESIRGKGPDHAWRFRGWSPNNSATVDSLDGRMSLAFDTRQMAIFEHSPLFMIEPGGRGTLYLRMYFPGGDINNEGAFYIIVKTMPQANENLTNPANGILLFHVEYHKDSGNYRLRMEGEAPSPSDPMILPGVWTEIWLNMDLSQDSYTAYVAQQGGTPLLVTTHRYSNGITPLKNHHKNSSAELIYLRNQSINAPVYVDALYFQHGSDGRAPTTP